MTDVELIHWVETHLLLGDGRTSPKAMRTLDINPHIKLLVWGKTQWVPGNNVSARVHCIRHQIVTAPTCPVCSSQTTYTNGKYQKYCSTKCLSNCPTVKQTRAETMVSTYGVVNPQQNVAVRKKTVDTMLERYGTAHALSHEASQSKRKQTLVDRFGTSNTNHIPSIVDKRKTTNLHRYGDTSYSRMHWSDEIKAKVNDPDWLHEEHITKRQSLYLIAQSLGISDKILGDYYKKYNIVTQCFQQSTGEIEVGVFIESLGLTIHKSRRDIISPFELDIFIPGANIGIEYCGLYWHSEAHKDVNYHLEKLIQCKKLGIRLLSIYEDEWVKSKHVVQQKLSHIFKKSTAPTIYGRHTYHVDITTAEFKTFMEANHIQGSGPASIKLGLKRDGVLVAAMGFIQQADGKFVLNRYATSNIVVGGFTKLLSHFKGRYKWAQIVSFADRRWSDGDVYIHNGFLLDKILPPDYEYVKSNIRSHKFNFRHKMLAKKLEHYDPALSEVENCHNHGYLRIYDCGLLRYVMNNPVAVS